MNLSSPIKVSHATWAKIALWAGVAVAAYFVLRSIKRAATSPDVGPIGTQPGGIGGVIGDILGEDPGGIVAEQPGGSIELPPPPSIPVSNPIVGITGAFVSPQDGGSLDRHLFGDTVRFEVEIANAGTSGWFGPLRLQIHEDYALQDESGVAVQNVEVPARSTKRFSIDYALHAESMIREPNLSVDLFAGTKHLGHVNVRVV